MISADTVATWRPSFGTASKALAASLVQPRSTNLQHYTSAAEGPEGIPTVEAELFGSLVRAAITVAQLSMHLPEEWRAKVLGQLQALLSIDNWDDDSNVLDEPSLRSFLRFVIYGRVERVPQLGINNKREITATWICGQQKVYMDFGARDACRAVFSAPGRFGQVRQAFSGKVGDAVATLENNRFDLTTAR